MWLFILINQSRLYLSVYNILCLFDWLISSVEGALNVAVRPDQPIKIVLGAYNIYIFFLIG